MASEGSTSQNVDGREDSERNKSIACQVIQNDFEDEDNSANEEETDSEGEDVEGSDQFANFCNFSLDDEQLKKSLFALHQGKGKVYYTKTCAWSRQKTRASAAYNVFKIKRWHLKDVNLVFDPLKRDKTSIHVEKDHVLWPFSSNIEGDEIRLKARSVDGILAKIAQKKGIINGKQKMENLEKLDRVLEDIDDDGKMTEILAHHDKAMDHVLDRQVKRAKKILPQTMCNPFYRFIFALLRAMLKSERKEKLSKATFQNIFKKLVSCVTACMNEEARIDCDSSMDGMTLDPLDLEVHFEDQIKTLTISSKPDLFIFERIKDTISKRAIAVVEVKGKHGDIVLHSDDEGESEEESGRESSALSGVIVEESDEDLPMIEKCVKREHKRIKTLSLENRRYTQKFLPELVGEMLCANGAEALVNIKAKDPGYSFGIAVVGFDVYFVTLVGSKPHDVKVVFGQRHSYYNVFITRPYNICIKAERRIVLKVLAAALYVEELLAYPNLHDCDPLSSLDLSSLNIV